MMDTNSRAIQDAELRRAARKVSRRHRRELRGPSYSKLVHAIFQSEQYGRLSHRAVKLLVDLLAQYRGVNNGDLTTAWSVMQRVGWRSKCLLRQAQQELEARGWIIKTRQGMMVKGKHTASLWALTFFGIDDCRDDRGARKLDPGVKADSMPLNLWRMPAYDTAPAGSRRRFKNKLMVREPGRDRPESRGEALLNVAFLTREPGRKCA